MSSDVSLRWTDHQARVMVMVENLLENSSLVDCTLAAEGQYLKAHKVILSACSRYFQVLFDQEKEKNPIVILKDVRFQELKSIIDFVYHGEVQVEENQVEAFLHTAKSLEIRGLTDIKGKEVAENTPVTKPSPVAATTACPDSCKKQNFENELADSDGKIPSDNVTVSASSEPELSQLNDTSTPLTNICIASTFSYVGCPESCNVSKDPPVVDNSTAQKPSSSVDHDLKRSVDFDTEIESHMKCDIKQERDSDIESDDSEMQNECDLSGIPESNSESNENKKTKENFDSMPDSRPEIDIKFEINPEYFVETADEGNDSHLNPEDYQKSLSDSEEQNVSNDGNNALGESTSEIASNSSGNSYKNQDILMPGSGLGSAKTLLPLQFYTSRYKRYTCSLCPKVFRAPSLLKIHFRSHTGEKPYRCHTCGAHFSQKGSLAYHELTHSGEKPYLCKGCGAAFAVKGNLRAHERTHSADKPFACAHCGAAFKSKGNLKVHERIHTGERPYVCDDCGAGFTQKGTLDAHKRTHTGERPHVCTQCGAAFAQRGGLLDHRNTHTGARPYPCTQCGARFSQRSSLADHARAHTGERPFACRAAGCGARFRSKANLAAHGRRHTGERPYKCGTCGAAFTQKTTLVNHVRCHTGERPFRCDACGAAFAQKGTLVAHVRSHTGEKPFVCAVCGARFTQQGSLITHMHTHARDLPQVVGQPLALPQPLPHALFQGLLQPLPPELRQQLPQDLSQQFPQQLPQQLPQELPQHLPPELPQQLPQQLSQQMPRELPQPPQPLPQQLPQLLPQ